MPCALQGNILTHSKRESLRKRCVTGILGGVEREFKPSQKFP